MDELVGLLQENELKSNEEDEEEDGFGDGNCNNDVEETLLSVSKGHVDGMVGEVDKFMARGGYHVLYIGSIPVSRILST